MGTVIAIAFLVYVASLVVAFIWNVVSAVSSRRVPGAESQPQSAATPTLVVTLVHGTWAPKAAWLREDSLLCRSVLAAFPGARFLALNTTVVDEGRLHLEPEILQNWIGWFGDRFDHRAAVPQTLGPEALTVEEHSVHLIEVGGADGT